MKALILSCSIGGGHDAAAHAIEKELLKRGHQVIFKDTYQIVNKQSGSFFEKTYIKMVQYIPPIFGMIYHIADSYYRLPFRTPAYWLNARFSKKMIAYLNAVNFDFIVMTHMFPAQIMCNIKQQGITIPKSMYITTDYTCLPLMEESDCDFYIIPAEDLANEFIKKGLSKDKLYPLGIPVSNDFYDFISKEEACKALSLDPNKKYILLTGGSMGAGKIKIAVETILSEIKHNNEYELIVICGNNKKLLSSLKSKYDDYEQISIISRTDKMPIYLKACDIFITKPGGLSSTEAAAAGIPTIHISPIPGCEERNANYFHNKNWSIYVKDPKGNLREAVHVLEDKDTRDAMRIAQKAVYNKQATVKICDLIEKQIIS